MSTSTVRIFNGADGTRAAAKLRDLEQKRIDWPYPWVHPPKHSEPVFVMGSLAAPDPALGSVPVLSYTVPVAMRFALAGIVQMFTGGGLIPGAGSAVWDLFLNQQYFVQGFAGLTVPLGFMPMPVAGFGLQPFMFPRVFEFEAGDLLQSMVTNTLAINIGDPNYFISAFLGWTWPDAGK